MAVEIGAEAPLFTLSDAARGEPYSLSDALQRGPVLIGIYKSSCGASKVCFPFLEKIYQAYPRDSLTVWGIAQDSPNISRSFARRTGVTFPILIDENDYATSRDYDIMATPTVFLIDPSGIVIWQAMGFQKPVIEDLSIRTAELLGLEPVTITVDSDGVPSWVPG